MPPTPALQVMISRETSSETDVSIIEKKKIRQFFMVGTIIDHWNDIRSSKLAARLWPHCHLVWPQGILVGLQHKRWFSKQKHAKERQKLEREGGVHVTVKPYGHVAL